MNYSVLEALGWLLIHSLWQVSLLVITYAILSNFKILKTAHSKYIGGIITVILISLLSIVTFIYYVNPEIAIVSGSNPVNETDPQSESVYSLALTLKWIANNILYISIAWFAGFLFYGIKLLGAYDYLNSIRRKASKVKDPKILLLLNRLLERSPYKNDVTVYLSEKIVTPITFGFFRASIVLPLAHINQLSLEDTEIILAHELAHIIRRDFAINIFLNLVKTIFYFHPAIWWLFDQIDSEREKATDSLALKMSHSSPVSYAKALLNFRQLQIEKSKQHPEQVVVHGFVLGFLRSKKQLLSRVENVLNKSNNRNQLASRSIALLLFAGIFLLLSFSDVIIPETKNSVHPALSREKEKSLEKRNKTQKDITEKEVLTIIAEEQEQDQLVQALPVALDKTKKKKSREVKKEAKKQKSTLNQTKPPHEEEILITREITLEIEDEVFIEKEWSHFPEKYIDVVVMDTILHEITIVGRHDNHDKPVMNGNDLLQSHDPNKIKHKYFEFRDDAEQFIKNKWIEIKDFEAYLGDIENNKVLEQYQKEAQEMLSAKLQYNVQLHNEALLKSPDNFEHFRFHDLRESEQEQIFLLKRKLKDREEIITGKPFITNIEVFISEIM